MSDQDQNNPTTNSDGKRNAQQKQKDNVHAAVEDLSLRLRQKQRDTEQLGINPDEILEEEEKRQPFSLCQQE